MPSPFAGMDPHIEAHHLWGDFQFNLIHEIERTISAVLPNRYVIRVGVRHYMARLDPEEEMNCGFGPAALSAARNLDRKQNDCGPVTMLAFIETEFRESFLKIFQTQPTRKLVTGIEVLSPSNKRRDTKGWRQYCSKREAYLSGRVNYVELDLLRRGRRMPISGQWPDSPYYALVCRKKQAPTCTVWPAFSIKPLPRISIPLLPPDPDIMLDLQPLVDAIYVRSRYEQDIDYLQPLEPPLSTEEQTWLDERLRKKPTKTTGR